MGENEKNLNFNIYYLNFSKVYEISMIINNVIISSMQRENSNLNESSKRKGVSINSGVGTKHLAEIKSGIGYESSDKSMTSSKMIELLDVKTTKSILLREIIGKCKDFKGFNNECKEGDLLKIDKVNLSMLDEENLRQILMLRKDALKGLKVEGFEVNNLISSMLQDYQYILKGTFNNSKDAIILKIPMEIEDEFESKYNIYDLLIGHLSVIGVYKGTIEEDFIKNSTFSYLTNLDTQQKQPIEKILPSSSAIQHNPVENSSVKSNEDIKFHFIDIIALIQDVQFKEIKPATVEDIEEKNWYSKTIEFFRRGGRKK